LGVLGISLLAACGKDVEAEGVGAGVQALGRGPQRDPALGECARALPAHLAEVNGRLRAHANAPSSASAAAVAELLTIGTLVAGERGGLVSTSGPALEVDVSARVHAMSDADLAVALQEAGLLVTCKMVRATTALVRGSLDERARDGDELALEDARRRSMRASDTTNPNGTREDAGVATPDAAVEGGTEAGADGGAEGGSGGGGGATGLSGFCRGSWFTDEELARMRDMPTGNRWYVDGGDTLGVYWGTVGRQRPDGQAFGLFAAYREIDGECFFGIGGSLFF
jgi:hypothetical protein